jgi:arylsulfatase A-like enzyme
MAFGLYKPHNPWTAPQRFFDMYPLENIQLPDMLGNDWDDLPPIAKRWAANPVDFDALKQSGQWKAVVRSYLACISFMDWNLGRILDALDKSRYKNNTIVCLVADNGFHLGEKQHFAKYALWEKTTHILNMWRVPQLTGKGVTSDKTVNLLDIYPTFNELCHLGKPPQQLDGTSLVPLLKKPDANWNRPSVTIYRKGNFSVRTPKYRYTRYADGEEELYDEEHDPNEFKNMVKEPAMNNLLMSFRKRAALNYAAPVTIDTGLEPVIK